MNKTWIFIFLSVFLFAGYLNAFSEQSEATVTPTCVIIRQITIKTPAILDVKQGEDLKTFTHAGKNSYIFVGKSNSLKNGNYDVLVLKADATGKTIWKKYYGESYDDEGFDIVPAGDGYIFAGSSEKMPFIAKINEAGSLIWHKSYTENIKEGSFSSIAVSPSGDIVAAGQIISPNDFNEKIFVAKFNSAGDEIKRVTFIGTHTKAATVEKIAYISENSYMVSGKSWKNGLLFTLGHDLYPVNMLTMNNKGENEGFKVETVYSGTEGDSYRDWGALEYAEFHDFLISKDIIYAIVSLQDELAGPMNKALMKVEKFSAKDGYTYSSLCRDFDMLSVCESETRGLFVSGNSCEKVGLIKWCSNIILNVDKDLQRKDAYSLIAGDHTKIVMMKKTGDGRAALLGEYSIKNTEKNKNLELMRDLVKKYFIVQTDGDFSIFK